MFVLNPDPYLLPAYRISPFTTQDVSFNHLLPESNTSDDYFAQRFKGKLFTYTLTGRRAINIALSTYKLNREDVVTIVTTTNNFYISSCVTSEIEKFCKWSRKMEANTKLIFVNHEFGFPYQQLKQLKNYNLPIIEDCCTAFYSEDGQNTIGRIGDFVIYSFPKIFPIQAGGLLVCNDPGKSEGISQLIFPGLQYIKNVLSYHIEKEAFIVKTRLINYSILKDKLSKAGFAERFSLSSGVVPGVYMFRKENVEVGLPALKTYLYAHGIQCSVFYGEDSFFIPVHQNLNNADLEYFVEVIQSFLKPHIK